MIADIGLLNFKEIQEGKIVVSFNPGKMWLNSSQAGDCISNKNLC